MNNIATFLSFLFCSPFFLSANGQVEWKFSAEKVGDKLYDVHVRATIDEGWHIFTQNAEEISIGRPTEIAFTKNPLLILEGKTKEIGKEPAQMGQYYHSVDFVQRVKLKANAKTILNGTVSFQVCTEEQCMFPKPVPFSVGLTP